MEQPYHTNDCACCKYLGSEHFENTDTKIKKFDMDYYMCEQNGLPTVIARFGDGADYISGLGVPKMLVREMIRNKQVSNYQQGLEKIVNERNEEFEIYILSYVALLAQKAGYLDNQLESLNSKKRNNVSHKKIS